MKTITVLRTAILAVAILSLSTCQLLDPFKMEQNACEPNYQPPPMIPGTDCRNFCLHVYEGTIDLVAGQWTVNCRIHELENPNLSIKLDYQFVYNANGSYLPTIRIRLFTPGVTLDEIGEGTFCRRNAFVRAGDLEARLQLVSYQESGGVMEEMLATFEETVGIVHYRILSTRALPFGNEIN